jgi:hypothetical protein
MTVNSTVVPSVTISTATTSICSGSPATFTASAVNGGSAPAYQWKVNNINAGTGISFTTSTLTNGAVVTCVLTSNAACASILTATSNQITMVVTSNATPSVSVSASSTTICAGQAVVFTANPTSGGSTPHYQWLINGSNAGTDSVKFTTAALANGDIVSVIMTSSLTCASTPTATSTPVSITVNPIVVPDVTITASSNGVCAGAAVVFAATTNNGGTNPTYNWFVNGSALGVNNDTLVSSTLSNNDQVTCVLVSNATCAAPLRDTSNALTMSINPTVTPSVSIATANTTICAGTSVTFTATPTNGGTAPTYQWKLNGVNIGAGSATFIIDTLHNGDVVSCVLNSNAGCATVSTATSNSITMIVNPTVTPTISISTANATVCSGSTVVFTSTITNGGSAPHYQWLVDGSNAGRDTSVFSSSTLTNGAVVSCVLTSSAACASPATGTSSNVVITVLPTVVPVVSIAASQNNICSGTAITFTASPTNGGTTPHYQWLLNGANVGTDSIGFTGASFNNGDTVSVILTSSDACSNPHTAQSVGIVVIVSRAQTPSVSITTADSTTICAGTRITFTATPTNGGANPTYQWQVNGTAITGATGSIYATDSLHNGDSVSCVLTSSLGCVTGSIATSNHVRIAVNAIPQVPVISQSADTLISSAAAGNQWILGGNDIAGATAPRYTAVQSGSYSVRVTQNGCSATSAPYSFIHTAIDEVTLKDMVKVYPTPFTDHFTIAVEGNAHLSDQWTYYITDARGREIARGTIMDQSTTVYMTDHAAGVYLVHIGSRNQGAVWKVIKQE